MGISAEEFLEKIKDKADAFVILHEPGQFTDAEVANMGLGKLISEEVIAGKRIRTYDISVDR